MLYPVNSRRRVRALAPGLFLSLLTWAAPDPAAAGTFTYNPGAGTTGVWDATTANWLNGPTPTPWPNTAADSAIFGGPLGISVTLQAAGLTAKDLTFQTDGYNLAGGALTLVSGGGSTITTNAGVNATFSAALLNGFTKAGAGTLVLANAGNANTGNVTVGAGTLRMGAANQVQDSAALSVASGATFDLNGFGDTFALSAGSAGTITNANVLTASTLTFNNTTALTYAGVFAGNLNLTDTTGSLGVTLAGTVASTHTGTTTFSALVNNSLNNSGGNAVGGNLTLAGGGVTLLRANQIADGNTVSIDASKATAVLRLNGFNETIGTLNSTGTADANAHVDLGSGTLTISGGTSSTFGGIITGAGSLIKASANNLTLTGANTFTGGITMKSGTLIINNDGNLGVSGGVYGALTLDGGGVNGGGSNVTLNAARAVNVTTNGGTFNINANTLFTLPTAVNNTGAGGAGVVVKSSQGTLVTTVNTGNPLGTGSITLSGGTLAFQPAGSAADVAVGGANALGTSKLSYGIGLTLALNRGTNTSVTLTLGNSAPTVNVIARNGPGTLILQPTATANLGGSEKILVNGGVLMTNNIVSPSIVVQDKTAGATLRGDFVTDAGGTTGLTTATYTNTNFTGSPAATDVVAVTAPTTLTGSAAIHALRVGSGGTGAPATVDVGAGNTLNVGSGGTNTQGGLILNGTVGGTGPGPAAITGGTLAFRAGEALVYVNGGNGLIASVITGSNGLTAFGNGVLTLSGANTYAGATNINSVTLGAMTLRAGAVNTLPAAGNVGVNVGSTLDLNSFNQTFATLVGSGATTLGTAALTVGDGTNFAYSGIISGAGTLNKQGSGTITLSGVSTFSGGTLVNAGTLQLAGGSNRLAGGSNVTVAASASLDLNNQSQTLGTLTGPGTVTNSNTGTPTLTVANNNATFTQDILVTGPVNYVKTGTGIVTLSAANTYVGSTSVTAGTLQVGNANPNAIPSASVLTVGATGGSTAATFDLNGNSITVGGLSSGTTTGAKPLTNTAANSTAVLTVNGGGTYNGAAGGIANGAAGGTGVVALTKTGAGTLTLTGANPFTGPTIISGGKLLANAVNALQATASLTVNNGGTLEAGALNAIGGPGGMTVNNGGAFLISGAGTTDHVNDTAAITLAAGTLTKGSGVTEGLAGSSPANGNAGSAPGLGALTLTAASHLDFGTGTVGALVFASFSDAGNFALTVDNWTGAARTEGTNGTNDRLLFAQVLSASELGNIAFAGFTPGATEIQLAGGYYEVVPVPEPGTWLAGLLGSPGLGWTLRGRRRRRRGPGLEKCQQNEAPRAATP